MGMKSGMNTTSVLIEKYLNSAYDNVVTVAANISEISTVADRLNGVSTLYSYAISEWTAQGHYNTTTNTLDLTTILGFTVGATSPYSGITVFVDGVFQVPNSAYTLGGIYENNTIIFSASLPSTSILSFIIGNQLPIPTISTTLSKASGSIVAEDGVNTTIGATTTIVDLGVIPLAYTPAENQLLVYVDGVYQSIGAGTYVETDTTHITFTDVVVDGSVIDVFKIV